MTETLHWVSLSVGGWAVVNGILHDLFVLRGHKSGYDRELLRLLMDGHLLITCGTLQIISSYGLRTSHHWAFAVSGVATVSLLFYCALIYPFLKSLVTITLNSTLLVLLVVAFAQS